MVFDLSGTTYEEETGCLFEVHEIVTTAWYNKLETYLLVHEVAQPMNS